MAPPEFSDTLQIPQFIVVNNKIKNSRRLEKICLACPFFCRSPDTIDKIGLNAKQISKDGDDQTGLTIFYCSENNTFCFMKFLRQIISSEFVGTKFRKVAKNFVAPFAFFLCDLARNKSSSQQNAQDLSPLLVAQATTAVEECDPD